jgi:sodium transport system ATP-binding protein
VISVRELRKSFVSGRGKSERRIDAVAGVSLDAPDGQITGLLGPNGAGKTTTLRMISTLVHPDSGAALVDGFDTVSASMEVRRRLGMLSDARGLYLRLTARENIRYYGRLRGMSDESIESAIDRLAPLIDMTDLLERRTDGFSQGERMKVAIARALIHDPQNVVLDEPSNGLDIMSTRALRELLRGLRDAGKCILMSSHIMQEVAALSERIVIIAHGRAIAAGTAEELMAQAKANSLEVAFVALAGHEAALARALAAPGEHS